MEVWISFATVFLKFEKVILFFFFVVQIFFTPSIKAEILNQLAFRDYLHIPVMPQSLLIQTKQ